MSYIEIKNGFRSEQLKFHNVLTGEKNNYEKIL